MPTSNRVFLSAVTGDIGNSLKTIADAIHGQFGVACRYRDNLSQQGNQLAAKLKEEIEGCSYVIHIVGPSYGSQPSEDENRNSPSRKIWEPCCKAWWPSGEIPERRSYTQMEFDFAMAAGKPIFVFFLKEGARGTAVQAEITTARYNDDIALQEKHRDAIKAANHEYVRVDSIDHLDRLIGKLPIAIGFLTQAIKERDAALDRAEKAAFLAGDKIGQAHADLGSAIDASRRTLARRAAIAIGLVATGIIGTGVAYLLLRTGLKETQTAAEQATHAVTEGFEKTSVQISSESDRVVAELSERIASSPGAKPEYRIVSYPEADILSGTGLSKLGRTSRSAASIVGKRVALNARARQLTWINLTASPDSDVIVNLPPAVLPIQGSPYSLTVLEQNMQWVSPSSFVLGSEAKEIGSTAAERPTTQVRLTGGFWIASTEMSNKQAAAFLPRLSGQAEAQPDFPASSLTWSEAMELCRKLTDFEAAAERIPAGWQFTLPTEAEWEYACRAGSTSRFPWSDEESEADLFAWHRGNSAGQPHIVGSKTPNAWGLYDMCGNVSEWCSDWFGAYPGGLVENPVGPPHGFQRVSRGGDFNSLLIKGCRSASRQPDDPQRGRHGLRIVLRAAR